MELTKKQIIKFQQIFKKEYGYKMSREEAIESASNLIRYLEIVLPVAYRQRVRDEKRSDRKN
ncbi:hypothetical protein A2V68_02705 [candidate division Kazan bacterium RBG_13_50_9]|uniref:Uncharacterized protein n=1 Tax=candidate division Kazan bacterium RBG_13_50_9 TaxID=1798535 RepID=A0A1F4NSS2_UNCK3|nr:MAG: hypothetical protein A2V68_02705 [candidate division Kazan bacterium RBG_13_50_9]